MAHRFLDLMTGEGQDLPVHLAPEATKPHLLEHKDPGAAAAELGAHPEMGQQGDNQL